jgi:GDP-D-mannose dehydratase
LIGDLSKAERQLGSNHETSWEELSAEMAHEDLILVAREQWRNAD